MVEEKILDYEMETIRPFPRSDQSEIRLKLKEPRLRDKNKKAAQIVRLSF